MRAKITAHLERLYHYRCESEACGGKKWCDICDTPPLLSQTTPGEFVYCPHCGACYEVIAIEEAGQS